MGKLKLIIVLAIIAFSAKENYAQYNFENHDLIDQQYQLVYAGCKNQIIISGLSNIHHAYLTSSASAVTQLNDSTYRLKPRYRTHMDTLRLFINDEFVQKELFLVMHPPVSSVQLGNIASEQASIDTILNNINLNLITESLYKDYEIIKSFQIKIMNADGEVIKIFPITNGITLTKEHLETIKTLQKGDQIEVGDIKVRSAQGMTRRKPNFIVTIG